MRRKDFCYDPIPEIWSDIDTQSQNICQILIPNRRSNKNNSTSKDKGLRAGSDYFGSKWPLERGSDLRTFFNTKILEISSPETDHVFLENLSSCTFIQLPLQNFEYNSKPQSQKIPNESIPQSQKFSSKRIPQSQNFQTKNYPKLAHIPVLRIVKYPPPGLWMPKISRWPWL